MQSCGDLSQLSERLRMHDAPAAVNHRQPRLFEHANDLLDVSGVGCDRLGTTILRRHLKQRLGPRAVDQVFRDIKMHDPGPTCVAHAQRLPQQLRDTIKRRCRRRPLRHRPDHTYVIEALIGPAPVRIRNSGTP